MTDRTVVHDTFVLERTYPATAERLFQAFADPVAKSLWFGGDGDLASGRHTLDFRVGGREHLTSSFGESTYTFDVTYMDIVPNQRIVYAYEMAMNGDRISVSVATVEILASGDGAQLVITEQGAFLDGLDDPNMRRNGTGSLLDKLGESLQTPVGATAN